MSQCDSFDGKINMGYEIVVREHLLSLKLVSERFWLQNVVFLTRRLNMLSIW